MPASRKEKDSTNHLEHRSINHPAGPKYLRDLALAPGLRERGQPSLAIGHHMQQPPCVIHVVRAPGSEEGAHRRYRHQSSSAREPLRRGPAEFCLMDKAVERHPGGTHGMPYSSADRTGMS